ncbi:MAG: J domain-containing protein, partial [Deltaproteobacteria bacterium]|nr:J domain-containing protein [Deltaproteobacteria bacterium]
MEIRQCYHILDLSPDATAEEINRHYRDLVNVWHPDRFFGNLRLKEKAGKKLAEINAAYDAVTAHLSSGHRFPSVEGDAPHAGGETEPGFDEEGRNETEGKDLPPRRWTSARPRFGYWKLVVPLMLVSLLMASGMILSKIENLMDRVGNPT